MSLNRDLSAVFPLGKTKKPSSQTQITKLQITAIQIKSLI